MRRIVAAVILGGALWGPAAAMPSADGSRGVVIYEGGHPDDHDDTWDLLLERAVADPAVREGAEVWVEAPDGRLYPLERYRPDLGLTERPSPPDRERLAGLPVMHPGPRDGFLSGKAVYVSQCHGYIWFDSLGRFSTQRPVLYDTVEDFHNPEGANAFLIPYLENAGARVYTARERDPNPRMALAGADVGQGTYTETGTTFEDGLAGFAAQDAYAYGVDPFDLGGTRRFDADSGDVATWVPDVPADGEYAIYVSWDADPSHAADAHYRITHPGGVIDRRFDQRVHGSTWQYVETLWLPEGSGGLTVELIADSTDAGAWLSADAVRVGGGTTQVTRYGSHPDAARWEAGAISYTQFNGAPVSVYDPFGNGHGTDHVARGKWADWEHPSSEDAVYVSWHSNASNGSARGTTTYFAGGGPDAPPTLPAECSFQAVEGSYSLARLLQDEIVADIQALHDPTWYGGWGEDGLNTACFSEVSPSYNDEMPSALVELAFHDNDADTRWLKDPSFRRTAARAMYKAVVRYFAERDGHTPVFLPEPPAELALVHGDGGLPELSWAPGPSGGAYGDEATSYRVEVSEDGRVWGSRFAVSGTSTALPMPPGATRFVRVVGINEGGMSFPSEVLAVRRSPDGVAPLLIVSAFDRFDRNLLPDRQAPYVGTVVTMDLTRMNRFDVAVSHGQAASAARIPFDSVSDEALLDLDLSGYRAIWWAAGEESSGTVTFTPEHQALIRQWVDDGGGLWVSGAEILWDLDFLGSDDDKDFALDVLGATLTADAAGSTDVQGEGVLDGVGPMDFAESDGAPYPVEWPDALGTDRPVVARYGSGEVAGTLADGVAMFGFPFETIGDVAVREAVAARLLEELLDGYSLPEPTEDTGTTPDLADTAEPPADTDAPPAGGGGDQEAVKRCGCVSGGLATWPAGAMMLALLGSRRRRGRRLPA